MAQWVVHACVCDCVCACLCMYIHTYMCVLVQMCCVRGIRKYVIVRMCV